MSVESGPDTDPAQVHLVGVGPGPVDLLTVRASRLIALSGTCLYEHGPVPTRVTALTSPTALVVDTTGMSIADALAEIRAAVDRGDRVVRLYPGDPTQDPALEELTDALDVEQIAWELVPGIPAQSHPAARTERAAQAERSEAPGLILVLGGTGEARRLADRLVTAGLEVVTSLAGKVSRPRLPPGEVRIGGFGGADGLAHWVRENAVSAVIDATDPFATDISATAIEAARVTGVPLLRLHRPQWEASGDDHWIRVPDMASAARVVVERFRRPMLTVGKLGATAFAEDARGSYLIRCAEPPPGPLPHRYLLVLDRGPFGVESERTLMARHRIDVLVTRNSGGESSEAKLEAARELRIPVVMVERPEAPEAPDLVGSVDEAARWLVGRFGSR